MVMLFRCTICGEVSLAERAPTHCPFCGAHARWIVDAHAYVEPVVPELTEISRKNLEFTYDLEINAAKIYHCIRKKSGDGLILAMFKAISKVEFEHAELVGKLIGKAPGCEIPFVERLCTEERDKSLRTTEHLESDAIRHYKRFLEEATEARVREVFQALIEVESDHLELVRKNL
ncbi:MAG: ferritin family protein [Desulfobulbales bacterium]|nr:ferritin family protein [Desulfobulbales bacterium]